MPELSIIIPTKNEEDYIGVLLSSIQQQHIDFSAVEIIVADADSTDRTLEIIESFKPGLNIRTVPGGLPAVARNNGVKAASGDFFLFIDADMELRDKNLLSKALKTIKNQKVKMATTSIKATTGKRAQLLFTASNIIQQLSRHTDDIFATTMFMIWESSEFNRLGGFDERAMHLEDFLLSRKVNRQDFSIIPGNIYTSPRRFEKEGYFNFMTMFVKNYIHRNNQEYFYKDISYWK